MLREQSEAAVGSSPHALLNGAVLPAQSASQSSKSLQGTEVDGAIQWDQQGNLVLDRALRRVFDYFLVLLGEEDLSRIRYRVQQFAAQGAEPWQLEQVMEVFDQYLLYKQALDEIQEQDGTYESMLETVRSKYQVAQAELGPEITQAFFAQEMAFDDMALSYIDALRRGQAPSQQRQTVETLMSGQPAMLSDQVLASSLPSQVALEVVQLREQGASEAEVWQLREQSLGAEAAERLAQLDQQREQWQQRYQDYQKQRQSLHQLYPSGLDAEDAIAQLQRRLFSEREIRRVQALDRMSLEQ